MRPIVPYLFVFMFIALPALIGSYLVVRDFARRDFSAGGFILVYALLFGGSFAYFHPGGKIVDAPLVLQIPLALAMSIIVGAVVGFVQRRKP